MTAELPAKLLPKSIYGTSLWVHLLVEKFYLQRPTQRTIEQLRLLEVNLSPGTITDGMKRIEPLRELTTFNQELEVPMMNPAEIESLAVLVAERVKALLPSLPSDDALTDVHEVAEMLGCSVPTIERLARSGDLPSVRVGRLRRYSRADVLAWQNEKKRSKH